MLAAQGTSAGEPRRHPRVPSRLRCWCEGENVTVYARVDNLSEGGLFLRTSTALERGVQVRVRLGAGGDQAELTAVACVAWTRSDDVKGPAGMGLCIESISDAS